MRHNLRTLIGRTFVWQAALLALMALTVGAACAANTVTMTSPSWSPNPAYVQQPITASVSSSDSAAPTAQNEDTVQAVWSYTTGTVYVSSTGNAGTFSASSGNYSIGWGPNGGDDTQSGFTFNGVFFSPGYYLVQVYVSVTYTDTTTGAVLATDTGTGYVGGSASLLSGGGSGNAANAMAAGAQPDAAGGGGGMRVSAITLTISAGTTYYNAGSVTAPIRTQSNSSTAHIAVSAYPSASNFLDLRSAVQLSASPTWLQNYQWTATGDTSGFVGAGISNFNSSITRIYNFPAADNSNSSLGTSVSFTVSATVAGSTTPITSPAYTVKYHLPFENWTNVGGPVGHYLRYTSPDEVSTPDGASSEAVNGGSFNVSWTYWPVDTTALSALGGLIQSGSVFVDGTGWGFAIGALGTGVQAVANEIQSTKQTNYSVQCGVIWSTTAGSATSITGDTFSPPVNTALINNAKYSGKWKMANPRYVHGFDQYNWDVETYGADGFDGVVEKTLPRTVYEGDSGDFTQVYP